MRVLAEISTPLSPTSGSSRITLNIALVPSNGKRTRFPTNSPRPSSARLASASKIPRCRAAVRPPPPARSPRSSHTAASPPTSNSSAQSFKWATISPSASNASIGPAASRRVCALKIVPPDGHPIDNQTFRESDTPSSPKPAVGHARANTTPAPHVSSSSSSSRSASTSKFNARRAAAACVVARVALSSPFSTISTRVAARASPASLVFVFPLPRFGVASVAPSFPSSRRA
mmetsp:Transcript_6254/g.24920  ORF Transcript_6254/g.24920 Transcript_6254/m.24920 type:complete len:231 (+) Transcript_6254:3518-4210(+)